jgi:RHS repeat-associated protein
MTDHTAYATMSSATWSRFTSKERDAETGLDYFGARYYSGAQGRFMSVDPVTITTERMLDPQQLNAYAYVRNNPIRLIDPTGKTLTLSGDMAADKAELCRIAGDACDMIAIDEKTGVVSFNTEGLDLTKNAGAALINDLVQSKANYGFAEGPTVETAGGTVKVDYILNLPPTADQLQYRKSQSALPTEMPKPGIADQVAFNPNDPRGVHQSLTNLNFALPWTIVFHELAEAYAKVDGGKGNSYPQAHTAAIERENQLRDQRPYLKEYNPGSGGPIGQPDNKIIIKK